MSKGLKSTRKSLGGVMREICMTSQRGHDANFQRIMPSAMLLLVEQGLFTPVGDTFEITVKGRAVLKDLEAARKLK